jgi:hypothetical protein
VSGAQAGVNKQQAFKTYVPRIKRDSPTSARIKISCEPTGTALMEKVTFGKIRLSNIAFRKQRNCDIPEYDDII